MTQSQYAYAGELRDPRTAAMLSMLPGLGQIYNGESRKGFLFLDVAVLNYLLLSFILLAPGIAKMMQEMGLQFGMKINHGVLESLQQIHFGSPVSFVVSGMALAFIAYAVRDAYDHAMIRRRRALYKDCVIELTEAASGSYIFHASVYVALAVMALFFFIPKPPARQITEIEIVDSLPQQVKAPTPLKTNTMSQHNREAHSRRFDETKPVKTTPQKSELSKQLTQPSQSHARPVESSPAASSSASASAAPQPNPIPFFKPTLIAQAFKPAAPMTPAPVKLPSITPIAPAQTRTAATPAAPSLMKAVGSTSSSNPAIAPQTVTTASTSLPLAAAPAPGLFAATPQQLISQLPAGGFTHTGHGSAMPITSASTGGSKGALQLPTGSAPVLGGGQNILPKQPGSGSSREGAFSTGAPGPLNIATHGPAGTGPDSGPVPQSMKHGTGSGPDGPGNGNGPAPVRAGGHGVGGFSDGPIRIIPHYGPAGRDGGKDESGTGTDPLNIKGKRGDDSPETFANPDFSAYMADLQRRIKHNWFPPREGQTKTVKVMFKIHTSGELSDVHLTRGSGSPISDQAALAAIQKASPFAHLPAHSPENVDIEFTFDYNVFIGRNF